MLLHNKNAVIYGAGGSLGGAVARAFAEAGAKVYLTGRRLETMPAIRGAEADQLDAFDESAVTAHLKKIGRVDISFNAVGIDVVQNKPMLEIATEDILSVVTRTMQTRLITAKAAGYCMIRQGSGVLLFLTATPGGIGYPNTGGFGPACSAVESLSRNLAAELGPYGVRAVCIRSGGSPDSKVFADAIERYPEAMADILRTMYADAMVKRLPTMADIANTAVFLASDLAAAITGVTVDATCGTTAGLNYRATKGDVSPVIHQGSRDPS
ncbi:SDR family NAD(P)-dependent oxidoreductase [Dinghuibacter silviterrae]|uniref:NADP-dependent 3-hydroxy acid dehydrogenase YdfG n=1 Tax=Dinghuibacter silviterrae TaxID=1539049 RepID=A0A4R8DUK2_9BACT|nr:SDR family oxidoreductase [Dinghuibacter silviterrae]TDX02060.1 NADP-dependent 3-hydroxy acid dehydrogenase YdfG [Dinghuibacter silviterrae]